jgi:hypothetical protein
MRLHFNRRQILRYSVASWLGAACWPGALHAGDAGREPFRFAVLNDLHYLNVQCGPWFEKVVKIVNDRQVEFTLIAGDLVEQGTPAQHGAIRDLLSSLKTPYYTVIGNHDYVSQNDRKGYEQHHHDRLNFTFDHRGWQFVGLDTSEGQKSRGVTVSPSTLNWLDTHLRRLDKKKPMVVFTHFPLSFGVPFILRNAKDVLERLLPFNLQAAFCGHYHGFTEAKHGAAAVTTNKCCSFFRRNHDRSPQKGFFLCETKDGKIHRTFIEVKP